MIRAINLIEVVLEEVKEMYLGIDFIIKEDEIYLLEVNIGVPGIMTDIIEGTGLWKDEIIRTFGERGKRWIDNNRLLIRKLEDLIRQKWRCSFYIYANQIPPLRLLYKVGRGLLEDSLLKDNFPRLADLLDKYVQYRLLSERARKLKKTLFRLPNTVRVGEYRTLKEWVKRFLEKYGECIIRPCYGWRREGFYYLNSLGQFEELEIESFPYLVQEYLRATFQQRNFDFRTLSFAGELIAVAVRIASHPNVPSNISGGRSLILAFPDEQGEKLEFVKLAGEGKVRTYFFGWEDTIWPPNEFELQETIYEPYICLIPHKLWGKIEAMSKDINQAFINHIGGELLNRAKLSRMDLT